MLKMNRQLFALNLAKIKKLNAKSPSLTMQRRASNSKFLAMLLRYAETALTRAAKREILRAAKFLCTTPLVAARMISG